MTRGKDTLGRKTFVYLLNISVYICAIHVHSRSCPPEFFMLYRGDDPIQDRSTKNRPVFGLGSSFGEPQADLHFKTSARRQSDF